MRTTVYDKRYDDVLAFILDDAFSDACHICCLRTCLASNPHLVFRSTGTGKINIVQDIN